LVRSLHWPEKIAAVRASPLTPGREIPRIRNRVGHCRRYRWLHRRQRRWECQGRLQYNANNVFPLNCHPIAAWIALRNPRVQNGENQIVENRLRGKEDSRFGQDEGRIFTEHHIEFHGGDFTWAGWSAGLNGFLAPSSFARPDGRGRLSHMSMSQTNPWQIGGLLFFDLDAE
jgi:hypothetical protein